MIKILHTGDIHLDSPFSSLDRRQAEIRRSESRAAFTSMMTYAKMCGADMLLIAGDLFDASYVTRDTVALLEREFSGFGKPIFITPGNHDPASENSIWLKYSFPDNVRVFTSSSLEREDIRVGDEEVSVYGFGFTGNTMENNPLVSRTADDPSRTNILLCHCDMTSTSSRDCPMTADILDSFGADYAALGHIHNPPKHGHDGRWAYCGCLDGRSFDERGPKGALIVEVTKNGENSAVSLKSVRFSKKRYERGELDVSGAETQSEVSDMIKRYLADNRLGEDVLLRLRLRGYVSPALLIDTDALSEENRTLFLLEAEDMTSPDIDPEALENDITLRGEVFRLLSPSLSSENAHDREVARRALRYALSAFSSGKNPF